MDEKEAEARPVMGTIFLVVRLLLKSGMGRDKRRTSRPVPATKIQDRTERETGHMVLFFFVCEGKRKSR